MWQRLGPHLLDALFVPFPPVLPGCALAAELHGPGLLRFARFALLPVRRLIEEEFTGPGSLLLAGSALHADLMPESAGSSLYGWLLAMLGHQYGWPVPEGGAGQLTAALVRRLAERGGILRCGDGVRQVVVRHGRAVAVRTSSGAEIAARRAVLAAMSAPRLYGGLVSWDHLPPRFRDDMRRFHWDYSTFKVDWALRQPVPWLAPEVAGAGTVHIAASLDELTDYSAQIATGRVPARPFVLAGQMTTADAGRSPAGTQAMWGYTHVPQRVRGDAGGDLTGSWDEKEREVFADRLEAQIARYAPGWQELIVARRITSPGQFEAGDANLAGGALNGGTTAVHQQLLFRPTPGLGTARDTRRRAVPGLIVGSPRGRGARRMRRQRGAHGAAGQPRPRPARFRGRHPAGHRPLTESCPAKKAVPGQAAGPGGARGRLWPASASCAGSAIAAPHPAAPSASAHRDRSADAHRGSRPYGPRPSPPIRWKPGRCPASRRVPPVPGDGTAPPAAPS